MENLKIVAKPNKKITEKMKKIFLTLVLALMIPFALFAQDARGRVASTIVADALAELPAQTQSEYNRLMSELASTAPQGVEMLAGMLVPADKGQNAKVEYALNGVAMFVTADENQQLRGAVKDGLKNSLNKSLDNPNKAFIITLLQICADKDDAPVLVPFLTDSYLGDFAIRAIISIPGTEELILGMVKEGGSEKAKLAYAVAEKKITTAESDLLSWLAGADDALKTQIYYALGKMGSVASVKTLAAAAKSTNYDFEPTDATGSYVSLLNTMVAAGDKKNATAAAKKLLKATDKSNIRSAALDVLVDADGKGAMSYITAALKDKDKKYRNTALDYATSFADAQVYAEVAKKLSSLTPDARADVMRWLGDNHVESQIDAVVANIGSEDVDVANSAIKAAGKIGGEKALTALVSALGGDKSAQATAALLSFKGEISGALKVALTGTPEQQMAALNLISKRRTPLTSEEVFALVNSSDEKVKAAAGNALSGVVTPADFNRLADLLEKAPEGDVTTLQNALKAALKGEDPDAQSKKVIARIDATSGVKKARFYSVLAQASNQAAVDRIMEGYENSEGQSRNAALDALLSIRNDAVIDALYDIAAQDEANRNKVLTAYTARVAASQFTQVQKYQLLRKGLELTGDAAVQSSILKSLESTETFQAMLIAAPYMDKEATAQAAANTIMNIALKHPEYAGEIVRSMLQKAADTFTDADAPYKRTSIEKFIGEIGEGKGYQPVTEWTAVVGNPVSRAKMKAGKLKSETANTQKLAATEWKTTSDGVEFTGGGSILGSKEYGNFEMFIDWKCEGEAGIAVRSIPEVGIGGSDGSGALVGNKVGASKPLVKADNKPGEWNTFYIKVVDDRVSVSLNGVLVTNNVILENSLDYNLPAYLTGQIELIGKKAPVAFRDIYINELPATPVFKLSPQEAKDGFVVLFDGTSMHNFTGNTVNYTPRDGTILVNAQYGSGGNLYTVKEYGDFDFRFEFQFLTPGVNNGIGIRAEMGKDAAYHGMEIQVLDHDNPIYSGLQKYQVHGSVYGVIPAKRIVSPALGTWNTMEIRAEGDHITVWTNGEKIVDGNIREATGGSTKSPTDHNEHPGLFNKSGHIGFLGHGSGIAFRNIRIKEL